MKRLAAPLLAVLLLAHPRAAAAGAWTLKRHQWQVIAGTTLSEADHSFDAGGRGTSPIRFGKAMIQVHAEYGWSDTITLFLEPQTVFTRIAIPPARAQSGTDTAIEGGLRFRLTDRIGIVSIEAAATTGAFNHAVSVNGISSGGAYLLRALYGTNFELFGRNGFLDIEAGERWIAPPHPDETPVDLTMGLWITPDFLVMAQNFNLIGGGGGIAPYGYYRSHKVEISAVYRVSERFSLQFGAFASPAGQNALVEQGLCLALWTQI